MSITINATNALTNTPLILDVAALVAHKSDIGIVGARTIADYLSRAGVVIDPLFLLSQAARIEGAYPHPISGTRLPHNHQAQAAMGDLANSIPIGEAALFSLKAGELLLSWALVSGSCLRAVA